MSLSHAILGLLQQQSMTGYDLKTQYFDQSVAHFWPADQAQIYRTLDKMAEEGWVESRLEFQEDRPNRKVYHITESGRAELARWLTEFQEPPTPRLPFLIQVFFAAQLPNEVIVSLFEQQLREHEARLAHYHQIPLPHLDDPAATREQVLQRLTLELGIHIEEAYLAWLRQAIEVVRQLKPS